MEKLPEISTQEDLPLRKQGGEEGPQVEDGVGAHQEAVLFVEKYRDFFEHYARGRVKFEPAPPELNTFAFDPETNTIFVNSRFYTSQGFSEEKTAFAILHEIEHMLEKTAWLETENGEKSFEKYLDKIKTSDGYSLMDNCVADLRENRSVLKRTNKKWREIAGCWLRQWCILSCFS